MMPRAGFVAALLFAAFWFAGCQVVFGDFEVEEVTGKAAGCSDKYRCNGFWLFCETKGGGDYRLIDTCASEVQCDSVEGRCTVCMPGEFRCSDTKLQVCNTEGTEWQLVQECATADECNLNSRSCRACNPGEMPQCRGPEQRELFECGADQHWASLGVCATSQLCDLSAQAIALDPAVPHQCLEPACPEPGAFRCEADGVSLSRCAADQTAWTPVDMCASPELCAATVADPMGADARGGKCLMPGCFPAGVVQCVDEVLQRCPMDLLAWVDEQTCVAPFQCNTNEQTCTGPCMLGELQCNGNILQRCTADQLWEDDATCVNASLCQVTEDPLTGVFSGGCVEPTCPMPGQVSCEGAVRRHCNTDQTVWDPIETCLSEALCNENDDRCDTPGCEPADALRCNPLNPSELQRCPPTLLSWESVTICAETEACNTDVNGPPCINQCPDPPRRCSDVAHETCSGVTGLPVWTGQATCQTADLCNCGLSVPNTCAGGMAIDGVCGLPVCGANLGSTRCDGSRLQTCAPGRNGWATAYQECGSAAMCVPGTPAQVFFDGGFCAACSVASERQCNGNSVRTCSADRRTWLSSTACPGTCINSGTNDYCAECTPGTTRCSNGDVQVCGANSLWGAVTDCGAFTCVDSGTADYCPVCVPGSARCQNNGDLQTCGSNQLWGPNTDCGSFPCIDSGTADYCAVCTAGATRCMGGDVQTCGSNQLWGTVSDCGTFMCIDNGTADYCAVCAPGDTRCMGGDVQTCGSNQLWGTVSDCGTFMCIDNGTADYCAVCTPGDTRCSSDNLQTCGSNSLWGAAADCGTLGCVDLAGNADYCAVCTPADTRCSGEDLQTCGTNELWGAAADCGALGCVDLAGNADYCAVCTPGDTRCSGEDLQTCGTNELWGAAADCGALGCVDLAGNADYCAVCTPADTRCSGEDLQMCGTNELWGTATDCGTFMCAGTQPNAYCPVCTPGATRCSGEDLQTCGTTGLWGAAADCGTPGCVDNTGEADYCAECTLGATLCSGADLLTCGADLLWDTMTCPAGCMVGPPDACIE
jgi:hypothetical protein